MRTLPQVTIAKLRGRLRAGGVELAMTADMRFAATGHTWLSQRETRMGIFPGGRHPGLTQSFRTPDAEHIRKAGSTRLPGSRSA